MPNTLNVSDASQVPKQPISPVIQANVQGNDFHLIYVQHLLAEVMDDIYYMVLKGATNSWSDM